MSAASRKRAKSKADAMLKEMALSEIRQTRQITQETMADLLHVKQSTVSKLESRKNLSLKTLKEYVKTLGGQLEIRVIFSNGESYPYRMNIHAAKG